MSQGLNGIGGVGNANTWSQTQSFLPYYYPYQSAIRILVGQASPLQSAIIGHYSSPDANSLGIGDYPLLQVTWGTSLYLGIQAGQNEEGNSYNGNTGIGYQSLYNNTRGSLNQALGWQSLYSNTTGISNTAIGSYALYSNTIGYDNIAIGNDSLYDNGNGYYNIAIGYESMPYNTSGFVNIAIGVYAGDGFTTGNNNTAIGYYAGDTVKTGQFNMMLGTYSSTGSSGNDNTLIGHYSGYNYLNSESANIVIGENYGIENESGMLRIGNPDTQIATATGQIAFSLYNLQGFGLSPIYGLDNRKGVSVADSSPKTLHTVSGNSTTVFKISARIFATSGSSATYVISWTENGAVRSNTFQVSTVNTNYSSMFVIQPDASTDITAQITSLTSTTVNVACIVEEVA
jgi:hypothetical protein